MSESELEIENTIMRLNARIVELEEERNILRRAFDRKELKIRELTNDDMRMLADEGFDI